jgi:ubiquitin C-terminal hydrolase
VDPGKYTLSGVVCYYGLHYVCYFLEPATGDWYLFDDAKVSRVGCWVDVESHSLAAKCDPCSVAFSKACACAAVFTSISEPVVRPSGTCPQCAFM